MTIFFETTSSTYLDTVDAFNDNHNKLKYRKVAMTDIIKFELLANPSDTWIKLIANANAKAQQLFNGENGTGDFLEAGWYHEMIADTTKYNYYQPIIKFNIDR